MMSTAARVLIALAMAMLCAPLAAQQDTGRSLRVAKLPIRTDGPKSLDPVKGSTVYDNQACSSIYDTLLQYKYLKRPLELEPCLAAEMPVITPQPTARRSGAQAQAGRSLP